MTRWLTENRDNVPMIFFTAGSIGLATIISMNAILFYRILSKDFFCSSTSSPGFLQSENKNKLKCESNILNEPGFHPVTKDVNRIMKSLFDDEASSSSANTSAEQNQQAKKNH